MAAFLPGARGTQPCPICGTQVTQSDRYPSYLCGECESRAVDDAGRRVIGYNSSLTGGFVLTYPDGELEPRVCAAARVWVDGTEWEWREARFGGTLVTPVGD